MTHLTLIRHGQTDWNLARRIQGSTDIPLNATGREDAVRAAEQLAASTHHALYTSPLRRARETAEIIAERLGLQVNGVVADVREREFGDGEGMLVADYLTVYGDWHAEVPGAESLRQVGDRAIAALHAIASQARRRSAPQAESVLVVAHGGVIRAVIDQVSGGTLPHDGEILRNGSTHRFVAAAGYLRLLEESRMV